MIQLWERSERDLENWMQIQKNPGSMVLLPRHVVGCGWKLTFRPMISNHELPTFAIGPLQQWAVAMVAMAMSIGRVQLKGMWCRGANVAYKKNGSVRLPALFEATLKIFNFFCRNISYGVGGWLPVRCRQTTCAWGTAEKWCRHFGPSDGTNGPSDTRESSKKWRKTVKSCSSWQCEILKLPVSL